MRVPPRESERYVANYGEEAEVGSSTAAETVKPHVKVCVRRVSHMFSQYKFLFTDRRGKLMFDN